MLKKCKDNSNFGILVNLMLSEKVLKRFEKTIIPVPIFRFGILFLSANNKEEFKKKMLFILNKKEEDLKDIAKIMTMHNISLDDLYIHFNLHFYDENKNLYHYKIPVKFTDILNKLDKTYEDIEKYVNFYCDKKFLTIEEIIKVFKPEEGFIEIIKENE